ncbi:UNVERIFIED_CONTAM: hypothetical protein K2H54_015303 [Gekko kuhli]
MAAPLLLGSRDSRALLARLPASLPPLPGLEAPPPFPERPLRGLQGPRKGREGYSALPKEAVALKVKEIMMDSFFSTEAKFLLAMRAVGELRRLRSSFGESCVPRGRQEESQETMSLFGS